MLSEEFLNAVLHESILKGKRMRLHRLSKLHAFLLCFLFNGGSAMFGLNDGMR